MNDPAKLRILIVAANPQFVRAFLVEQIRALIERGYSVMLVCSSDQGATLESELGCPVDYIPMSRAIDPASDVCSLISILKIIWRWRPDVVHSHTPKAGLIASLGAALLRIPIRLHTLHGLRSDGLLGRSQILVRAMEHLTALCCTQCFAVSSSLRRRVISLGLCTSDKISMLGDGSWAGVAMDSFDPALYRTQAAAFRAENDIDPEVPLVACIGRIARDKGIETLAAAWKMLKRDMPSARLLIAGPIDESDPVSQVTLEELRTDESVILIDRFIDKVAALLAASDIFVQPSLREGLGVSALEASAMQLPLVASRVTGLVDAVQDQRTGLLVTAGDPHALARGLKRLIRRPALRGRFGQDGRAFVDKHFNRKDVIGNCMKMYDGLKRPRRNQPILKELSDVMIAASLLCIMAPVMLCTSFAILLLMGRPIFFTQQRGGLNGKTFALFKFRTMRPPAPGQAMLGTDGQRRHWLGDLLRRLSLDELPQLFNVLSGDMSLVGPRPLLAEYLPRYSAAQARRHAVRPGITGLAQVNGRNALSWEKKFELDVWYVDHLSFGLDLRILFRTLCRFIDTSDMTPSERGAMPEFFGSSPQPIP